MYMFSIEQKVYFGDKHLNSNSTVTDVALGNSLTFRPTVIKADIWNDWQVNLYYSVSPCTVFFERNSKKKIWKLENIEYIVQCNLHLASCVEADRKVVFAERFGVTFRNSLLMALHVAVVSVLFFFSWFCNIFNIPKFLSYDLCKNIIHSIITFRND